MRMTRNLLVVALGIGMTLPGCATKKDIRTLQQTMLEMQNHQDSVLRGIQRQNQLLLDTLRHNMNLTLDTRGQQNHSFAELNGLFESNKALNGQILEATRQLAARIDGLDAKLGDMKIQASQPSQAVSPSSGGGMTASQTYDLGITNMRSGSFGSARAAFQAVVREHHDDPVAADAQFQIAETYTLEESFDDAYKAYERVPAEWPNSPRAGESLYRAGKVAEDAKEPARAKRYYQQVVNRYPDFSKLAQAGLKRLTK